MISLLVPRDCEIATIAAETFRDLWNKVCGETPAVVNNDPGGDLVVFGSDAVNSFSHAKIIDGTIGDFKVKAGGDGYQIVSATDGGRTLLFLAQGRPRALLYAVYRFFELRADCRWFWDGDIVPKGPVPSISGMNTVESPRFDYRGLRYFAHRSLHRFQAEHWDFEDWKREIDWIVKRRMNFFMLRIGIDDLFQRAFPDIVHAPEGYTIPEATPKSYDDRTLFWPMEYRSEIRKRVLAYARARDLIHPEDVGTMTHWYSRTPLEYLEKVKPRFIPQANSTYNQPTGLVWDIADDKNLDAYFKLTDAHIRHYGSPAMFHTIGLAERFCFKDHKRNHEMKRYAYRRIISKLREKYGDAPLLIGTWDFINTWSTDEVREFISELDPENTIVFDYTSDIWDERNNFQNWNVVGKFPWIYGIFHAYEASSEIRGNYGNIADRFPKAIADPLCKGIVFWPENSHQDTLMLDYFSQMGWDPSQYRIDDFLPGFCERRYGAARADEMLFLWQKMLPLAKASRWGTVISGEKRYFPQREIYPDLYFHLKGWMFGTLDAQRMEYFAFEKSLLGPLMANAREVLTHIARTDFATLDDFTRRDFLDMARTITARMLELGLARLGTLIDAWTRSLIPADDLRTGLARMRRLGVLFSDLLEASPEFSLNASLDQLRARHETNPDFEFTLKGNANNSYCRSFIYELARFCYEREFAALADFTERRIAAGNRGAWIGLNNELEALFSPLRDAFFEIPLREMAPDLEKAVARLPETLLNLADLAAIMP